MARRKNKFSSVDPAYLQRQRKSLKRVYRKSVLFNEQEMAAIDEYCRRFRVRSRSALIREALMSKVLEDLQKNQPTLF